MTNTEKAKAKKILDKAIRKYQNANNDWKEYERYMEENDFASAEMHLRKFSRAVNYTEGIYDALIAIGFKHPKMKEFSDILYYK